MATCLHHPCSGTVTHSPRGSRPDFHGKSLGLRCSFPFCTALVLLVGGTLFCPTALRAEPLKLRKHDHLCLVGNALGERLQHNNQWESLLHQRFHEHELVVRNLCFPGDRPFKRLRSQNFGSPEKHLTHSEASVVLYFFGFNESFAGKPGLKKFQADLTRLVKQTQSKDFGNGPPRIVLVTPIAFEDLNNRPGTKESNQRLEMYSDAIKQVGDKTDVHVADVFTPTMELFAKTDQRLTFNGCHLNADGHQAFASILLDAIVGKESSQASHSPQVDPQTLQAVQDKNFHWWHRYRAVNGYSIYGARGRAGQDGSRSYNNRDVMERERAILDQMTANRDRQIWQIVQGKPAQESIDDSNTLPFFKLQTNVGLPNDANAKRGKLGSLQYLSAQEQKKRFRVQEGFEIQLVASEEQFPELANPVALNFDGQGRLWVATMPSYPHWQPKTKLDDKILILEDNDQDGTTDKVKVFAGGLHQPTGFEISGDGVWVAEQPDVLFLQDTDGDDVADTKTRRLFGFDSADSHHGISAFEWGPGGNLYFQEGTFKFSQVETPDGLLELSEAGIWRFHRKNQRMGVFSNFAFSNPWGHVFDRWGQSIVGDASSGHSYFAAPISGRIDYPLKHAGGDHHRRVSRTSGGDPQYRYPTLYRKRIRPLSGCAMISSSHFPEEMQGNFLVTNVIGDRGVLSHQVREQGSGLVAKEVEPLLLCDDGNFRPVDLQIAPDGSLYIVDWHNALIGHLQHNLRDPSRDHSHGRIWRIKHKTRPLIEPAKIAGAPIDDLLDLLKSPEDRTRYRARRELAVRNTDEVMKRVAVWLKTLDPKDSNSEHHQLEALWVCQTHHVIAEPLLDRVLNSPDHRARAAATRVLSFWLEDVAAPLPRLRRCIEDEHPRVRLEAVRALSFLEGDEVVNLALSVMDHEMDAYLQYTLDETMRRFDQLANGWQKLFLGRNAASVAYQVQRLSDPALFAVSKDPNDPKSIAIYEEILTRAAASPEQIGDAINVLVGLKQSDISSVAFETIKQLNLRDGKQKRAATKLAKHLFALDQGAIESQLPPIMETINRDRGFVRSVAIATAIVGGQDEKVFQLASRNAQGLVDYLRAIPMIPKMETRSQRRDRVTSILNSKHFASVQRAAIDALGSIKTKQSESFHLVSPLFGNPELRDVVVPTLRKFDEADNLSDVAPTLLDQLVKYAEQTSTRERTTPQFTEAMELANTVLTHVPAEEAKKIRQRLDAAIVRVVRLQAVAEEMRYDVGHFAVQAGRSVELIIENDDVMPHNLVITKPGGLKKVAQLGLQAGPTGGKDGLPYVPKSNLVLHATGLIDAHGQTRLSFQAPKKPGEYPYVCTFPQHWYRMYGVMIVVEDLDEWLRNPVEPTNPIGSNRSLVANWTVDNFDGEIEQGLRGRNPELGKRIFAEASCIGCHKVQKEGGVVGPDLTNIYSKMKGDHAALLRSILEPSHTIDEKYAMQKILTYEGEVFTGVLAEQDDEKVKLLSGVDAAKTTVILREDIEVMQPSAISMMPKALLDQYTKDEIFELLHYLQSVNSPAQSNESSRSSQ